MYYFLFENSTWFFYCEIIAIVQLYYCGDVACNVSTVVFIYYTLNLKFIISPSTTTYSLPSTPNFPASLIFTSVPNST